MRSFEPGVFQEADGAIPIIHNDDRVDAYFAIKALLTARDAGLDIKKPGTKFVEWLLPRQKADGRFERYLRQHGAVGLAAWKANDIADADDALLAMWVELLYTLAPESGLPVEWRESAMRAGAHLTSLRDRRGIYYIARDNRVGLFMDNSEIYSSFVSIARDQTRLGHTKAAAQTTALARQLAVDIQKVFWDGKHSRFLVSTQIIPESKFYPDATAQVFPMLTGLETPAAANAQVFDKWLSHHGSDWLSMKYDEYPWGLVAFAAWKMGDHNTALAWQNKNRALRHGSRWTVVEEAVFQGLEANLASGPRLAQADPRLDSNS